MGRWELLGTARVSPTDAPRLLLVVSLRCADGDPPPASNLLRINVSKEITNYSMRFGGDGHDASASGRRLPLGSTLGRFGANATPYAPLLPNGTAPRIHQHMASTHGHHGPGTGKTWGVYRFSLAVTHLQARGIPNMEPKKTPSPLVSMRPSLRSTAQTRG